jgi:hypothetical protein
MQSRIATEISVRSPANRSQSFFSSFGLIRREATVMLNLPHPANGLPASSLARA